MKKIVFSNKQKRTFVLNNVSKIFILLLIFSLCIQPAFAAEQNNAMYIEKQQIQLENLDLEVTNEGIKVKSGNSESKEELENLLAKSNHLEDFMQELINNGEEILAIGSSTVMLKEVGVDSNGEVQYVPMTQSEVMQVNTRATGAEESRGNLTLYTMATKADGGLHAYSCAEWSDQIRLTGENKRATERDYISITAEREGLLVVNRSFSANTQSGYSLPSSRYSCSDLAYTTVVYDFEEYNSNSSVDYDVTFAVLSATYNGDYSGNIRLVSKYVHTWKDVNIGVSIGAKSVTFNISNSNAAWQIPSEVILTNAN